MPSHRSDYATVADREQIQRLMNAGMAVWRRVEAGDERPTDGVLMKMAGYEWHVGVVTSPGRMLHIRAGNLGSRIESYDDATYKRRVLGFYRHERLSSLPL